MASIILQDAPLPQKVLLGCVTMKSDLKAISTDNSLFKYADDTTLLVPEHTAVDIVTEFHHTQAWATANKLCINTKKTNRLSCTNLELGPITSHCRLMKCSVLHL